MSIYVPHSCTHSITLESAVVDGERENTMMTSLVVCQDLWGLGVRFWLKAE